MKRPIATVSSQPQNLICTVGRVDQLWTKADIAHKGEGRVAGSLRPGVSTREDLCLTKEGEKKEMEQKRRAEEKIQDSWWLRRS